MEKNISEIKNMTQHQLEYLLNPFIEKERLKYNYINLPQSIYLSELKEIEDTMDFSDGEIDIESMIKNCSKRYIADTLEEENQAIKVVSNFIKKNIKLKNKYQDNIISFEKIVNFFHDFDCFPPPNLLIELIDKNDTLNKILQDVVENNLEILQKYNIDSKFSDDISKNFIELYCLKNNIEIKKEDDIQEEDYTEFITDITNTVYTDDSVKMYLQEIHKPILTKEQEKSLALRIRNGDEKAKELFRKEQKQFDYIYCSPLKRTKQTLEAIIPGSVPIVDERIIEISIGEWEGKKKDTFDRKILELFRNGKYTPPKAETILQIDTRVCSFIETLFNTYKNDERILIVTHNGVMRSIKRNFIENFDDIMSKNLGIIKLEDKNYRYYLENKKV